MQRQLTRALVLGLLLLRLPGGVRADAIATARFTAMSNAESRGCIGGISFAEPVPMDSP